MLVYEKSTCFDNDRLHEAILNDENIDDQINTFI